METLKPCRGLCFVKRVETEDVINGIVAPADVVDKWTAAQVDIVALGAPQLYEEIPERLFDKVWEETTRNGKRYFYRPVGYKVDDWVLIQPRVLMPTDVPGLYVITYENILGIFSCGTSSQ